MYLKRHIDLTPYAFYFIKFLQDYFLSFKNSSIKSRAFLIASIEYA